MAAVTKFAYLKDLLEPKVRAGIDGLPFSSEGYERAKNILRNKYGKTSEIENQLRPKYNGVTRNQWRQPSEDPSILRSALI